MGKIATFGEKARKIVSGLKFNYLKEDDSELGRVDFGVLTVAMMVAALDGVIRPEELAAFAKLAKKCRVSDGERVARYESALHSAGYMMLISRSGASKRAIVETFVHEAEKVLPHGFAGGKAEDIRRAFVIWVTMGLSDGEFQKACIAAALSRRPKVLLLDEPLDGLRVVVDLLLQHLDGDGAVHELVMCLEHHRHAADADDLIDMIAAVEDLTDVFLKGFHRSYPPPQRVPLRALLRVPLRSP